MIEEREAQVTLTLRLTTTIDGGRVDFAVDGQGDLSNIDVDLLREQRDYLLTLTGNDLIDGVINLCDVLLDVLEGYRCGPS